MNAIKYVGETLWIGQLGHALIVLALVSALFTAIAFSFSIKHRTVIHETKSWKNLGRIGFILHSVCIFGIVGLIFYAMINFKYEYNYVFSHVSDDLDMKYVWSAMWEGQEGSFLLWMIWHAILGLILLWKRDSFEAPVIATIAAVETVLVSMILGIHIPIGEHIIKIGSNPLELIRDTMDAPIFKNADYLSLIKGRGLNPLLQNYWMTIHPPTLFLGFASTVVPFAYAIGGLILKEDRSWLRPVLKWSLFSGGILGTGILMGSLWAFEALSFGGYWAWDPVENTSLVPWIVLIGGIHGNLIANSTGHSIRATYIAYIMAFLLVLYSTLLTRSGILGDTSAHAFTEMGLEWQLTFFIALFTIISTFLLVWRYRSIPAIKKEESIYSREFWMFVGSLILFFSALLITTSSSLPVYNTIVSYFDSTYVGRVIKDPVDHYNKYQLWIGVLVSILSSFAVWLRYREEKFEARRHKPLLIKFAIYTILSAAIVFGISKWISLVSWQFVLLVFTCSFSIISNLHYLTSVVTKDIKLGAAAISHVGFAMMTIGIVATGLNYYHLSNPFIFKNVFEDGNEDKYVQLIKESPLLCKDHVLNYTSDTLIGRTRFYNIDFKKVNDKMEVLDSFTTRPYALYANDFSKIASFNPDTKHYFFKDVFTCVMTVPPAAADASAARELEDSIKYKNYSISLGDSIAIGDVFFKLKNVNVDPKHPEYDAKKNDAGFEFEFDILNKKGEILHSGKSAISLNGQLLYKYPDKAESLGLRVRPQDAYLDQMLTSEDKLLYKDFKVKKGQTVTLANGAEVTLLGFDQNIVSKNYSKEDGDIAVSAILKITFEGKEFEARPIFVIRGNAPMSIKDYCAFAGVHARLSAIDPTKEEFTLKLAYDPRKEKTIPVEIATDVPRTDYLILEAKVFPGINLYWLGTILMMLGLFISWIFTLIKNKKGELQL